PVPSPRTRAAASQSDLPTQLQDLRVNIVPDALLGYGAPTPIFVNGLPSTFSRRLSGAAADFFYSGVFRYDDLRIGFLRIPSFAPANQAQALARFNAEIAFFRANTDGLIIDEMRNPGGNACYLEQLVSRLTTEPFRTLGWALRPWPLLPYYTNTLISAKSAGAPFTEIAQHEANLDEIRAANREGRLSKPLPLCGTPGLTVQPFRNAAREAIGYDKPIMVLTDEFSTSAGDAFPAVLQDNGRALIYGYRTNGAGGNVVDLPAGTYSEANTRMTLGLMVRNGDVVTDDYPSAPYVENIGVRPDLTVDYMTKENLLNNGATFVTRFTEAMAEYIRQRR
ncbi:MAG: hypothetical protein JNK87_29430, partial [Bryobacterales bacterium]|nr:hypothetical protein [Bryobacterales bacterium]